MGISIASLLSRFPHFAPFQPSKYPHHGLIHMGERKSAAQGGMPVGRVNPSPAGGRDLHTASSPPLGGGAIYGLTPCAAAPGFLIRIGATPFLSG